MSLKDLVLTKEKHPNWKGGIYITNSKIRNSPYYKDWRKAVFKRDDFTCQSCGVRGKKGIRPKLQADHLKSFALYPNLRFNIGNGQTLCISCHSLKTKAERRILSSLTI